MTYRVTHTTSYTYSSAVSLCHNLAHLTPRHAPRQACLHSELQVNPVPALLKPQLDFFGNRATYFIIEQPHEKLTVTAVSLTEVMLFNPPPLGETPPWERVRDHLQTALTPSGLEARQFLLDSPYVKCHADLAAYAAPSFPPGRPLLAAARELTERIHADFRYDSKATTVHTPLREVFRLRRGVCQDFAHLQIACLRSLGLAARYVSGYLRTNHSPDHQRLRGADASHAWLSVYCLDFGWIDLDPTNNLIPSDTHILLAWGRDYDDVSPIKGVNLGGGSHTVQVAVDVVFRDGSEIAL
ncbi:MAG TPA: transglutaminase family protein [Gemmataceae bacterium]|nr:transglutaminase family protein [Gemmataceae bacterium]